MKPCCGHVRLLCTETYVNTSKLMQLQFGNKVAGLQTTQSALHKTRPDGQMNVPEVYALSKHRDNYMASCAALHIAH